MPNRILIIDDDVHFIDSMTSLLGDKGFEVSSANAGEQGFQKVKAESPDVIVLSMTTNNVQGDAMAHSLDLDASITDIPVLYLLDPEKEIDCKLPVEQVLVKTDKPEDLLADVLKFIDKNKVEGGIERRKVVDKIRECADRWKDTKGSLIMILHDIQNHFGYIPRDAAFRLSNFIDVPLARIYEVITFYHYFKLQEPGQHNISVCMGTACYLKGAPKILDEIKNVLNITEGETTEDKKFHLQAVRCVGCCGLAPVMLVDDKVYGKITKKDVIGILAEYTAK